MTQRQIRLWPAKKVAYTWCSYVLETYPEILEDHPAYALCAKVNPIMTARRLWADYGARPNLAYSDEDDGDPFDSYGWRRPRMFDLDQLPDFLRAWASKWPGISGPGPEDKPAMTAQRIRILAKRKREAREERYKEQKDITNQVYGTTK